MLRRANERDVQQLTSQDDPQPVFDLQHSSRYRINLLRALQGNPHSRLEALTTISKIVAQWIEEHTISRQEWVEESKVAAIEDCKNVMTSSEEACAQPKFSRGDSFQMGFEEVFNTEHDEKTLPSIDEGISRLSPGHRTEDWLNADGKRSVFPPVPPEAIQDVLVATKDNEQTSKKELKLCFRVYFGGELEKFLKEAGIRNRSKLRDRGFIPDNSRDEIISEVDVLEQLRRFYVGLMRYNGDCPYKDIRMGCKALLKKLEVRYYSTLCLRAVSPH
jgi:hypothetical protein